MKKLLTAAIISIVIGLAGCKKDSEFLNVTPFSILTTEQSFSDANQAVSIVADLYNRVTDLTAFKNGWESFIDPGEAVPSTFGHVTVQRNGWGFGEWNNWNYTYIREINLFIERATASTALSEGDKKRFIAEGRFLRAAHYYEMVKRMGGVPLITKSLVYDYSGDASSLQYPCAKESEVYDFIISELTEIRPDLPRDLRIKDRATQATALTMQSHAALYGASTAKYG